MQKAFFFHHIRRTDGSFDKQIDVCDSLDEAKGAYRSFLGSWGYGYRADTDFVSAEITDESGTVLYRDTWLAPSAVVSKCFMHRILHNGENYTKGIEVHTDADSAKQSFNAYLGMHAYGREANTDFVSCEISDGFGARLMAETWRAPEPEPEPET